MHKYLYLIPLLGVMFISQGCSSDEPGLDKTDDALYGNNVYGTSLRLKKLDLAGAKSLAIADGPAARSSADNRLLFKMDDNGNLSAVCVEVAVCNDDGEQTVSSNYTLGPGTMFSIGDRYVYMSYCKLYNADGHIYDITKDYESQSDGYSGFNILVNKRDGKIYYVPQAAKNYFPVNSDNYQNDITVATDGTFYMHAGSGVVKVEVDGDNASISTFGPQSGNGYQYCGSGLIPLDNGPVIRINPASSWGSACQTIDILYQNGGFETFDGSNDKWHAGFEKEIQDEYTFLFNNGRILAVKRPASNFKSYWDYKNDYYYSERYESEEVALSLVEITIGSSYGNIQVGEPFFTLTGTNEIWKDYSRPEAQDWTEYARQMGGNNVLYALGDYYMIGNILAINKNTLEYRDLVAEGISEHVIVSAADNVYNGKAWNVWYDGADWFDPSTMEYGQIRWDYPEHIDSTEFDIPNGKIMIVYLNPADGSKHLRIINIETGEYTESDVQTSQQIIQLIPLN
jgi:lipoprotein